MNPKKNLGVFCLFKYFNYICIMKISEIQKRKFYEMGNELPKCVNVGCKNKLL